MHDVYIDLKNMICKNCDNLNYDDWYRCNKSCHTDKDGFLMADTLDKCDFFKKRMGSNYKECKDIDCPFWCNNCSIFNDLHKGRFD